jgi:hypothetical protein
LRKIRAMISFREGWRRALVETCRDCAESCDRNVSLLNGTCWSTILSMIGPSRASAFNLGWRRECILNARRDGFFELNTTLSFWKTWSSEMNVSSIDGEPGERRTGFALLAHSAHPLDGHWSVSDLVALTKPRVMMLVVFTALVGLSIAPSRLDPPTTLAALLAIAAGTGACDRVDEFPDAALKRP